MKQEVCKNLDPTHGLPIYFFLVRVHFNHQLDWIQSPGRQALWCVCEGSSQGLAEEESTTLNMGVIIPKDSDLHP